MPGKRRLLAANISLALALLAGDAAGVSYVAQFQATWSATTHPGKYPAGAHFSSLIGGVHNSQTSFWTPGALASPGIEQMAEVGGTSLLRGEVQAAINAGSASAVLQGSGVVSPGSTSVAVEVTAAFPLVTLVTMVAPTPDWFVGVHGLDLRDGVGWKSQVIVDLYSYDAGTEEGTGFSLANPATTPPVPIALLQSPLGPGDPRLGTLTFTRTSQPDPADFDGDFDVDDDDAAAWSGGFGLAGSALKTHGDADSDQDVDGADFLLWQQQLNDASPAAATSRGAAAPEPGSSALAAWLAATIVGAGTSRSRRMESPRSGNPSSA